MMNWNNSTSGSFTYDTSMTNTEIIDGSCDNTNYISFFPDPLIDWLPNSCLYTKYVPTWHLIRSYK